MILSFNQYGNKTNLDKIFKDIVKNETGEDIKPDILFYSEDNPEQTPVIHEKMQKGNMPIFGSSL